MAKFERDIGNGHSHIKFEVILDDGGEQECIFDTVSKTWHFSGSVNFLT